MLFMYYYQAVINTDAGRDLCIVQGENGNTPLHSSCQKGDLEIVKVSLLIKPNMRLPLAGVPGFLKLLLSGKSAYVYICVCVCACVCPLGY